MNMADNLEQGVEDNVPDTGIDLGGIINGLFGLSGEVGELTDMVKKWIFHESNFDEEHALSYINVLERPSVPFDVI